MTRARNVQNLDNKLYKTKVLYKLSNSTLDQQIRVLVEFGF